MEINCLSCGFKVDLADSYDNYEGQIKCFACGAILAIRTQEGNVCTVTPVEDHAAPPVEEVFEVVRVFDQGRV
jgi:DNA-directed RNA polymerase subunit N (RpoN/RPB10)